MLVHVLIDSLQFHGSGLVEHIDDLLSPCVFGITGHNKPPWLYGMHIRTRSYIYKTKRKNKEKNIPPPRVWERGGNPIG
jgi:hypothetical protein